MLHTILSDCKKCDGRNPEKCKQMGHKDCCNCGVTWSNITKVCECCGGTEFICEEKTWID